MNILQIVHGLDIGGDSGGAEKFGVELARAQRRAGNAVSICAFFRLRTAMESEWQERLNAEGIRTFFLVEWGGYGNAARFGQGLRALARELRGRPPFDVVHSHFQIGSVTALLLKWSGHARAAYRTAHIVHEWQHGRHTWWLNRLFVQLLFPLGLNGEAGVSQDIVDHLAVHPGVGWSGRKPVLIRNAVSFSQPPRDPARAPSLGTGADGPRVGFVGRLETQKGVTYLLEAVPAVLVAFPMASFTLIGDGSLRPELEEQADRLGIRARVCFTGIRADVPYLLQELDLFVLPSLWEGFPTVLLESMVCGAAVIATDIPGTRELVQDGRNGWLVPPRDPAALAGAILEALRDPPRRASFARQAAQDVQRFTIDTIAEEYARLYAATRKPGRKRFPWDGQPQPPPG